MNIGLYETWRQWLLLPLLAGVLWILVWKLSGPGLDQVFNWDEVDYVQAASLGLTANLLESGSLPAGDYFRAGWSKYHGVQVSWPESYDEAWDPFLLRHYHPPCPILPLAMLPDRSPEWQYRMLNLLGALGLILIMLLAYASLTESPSLPGLLLVSAASVWMSLVLFRSINYHGYLAAWMTASAALTSGWLRTGQRGWGIGLALALAGAFLTLETALCVAVAVLCSIWIWGRTAPPGLMPVFSCRRMVVGALLMVTAIIVVWPGFLTHLYLAKAISLYGYRLLRGEEYGGLGESRGMLLWSLLPLLGFAGAAFLLPQSPADRRCWGPFMLIGGSYAALLFWVAISPTYVIPAMGPVACVAGYAVDRHNSRLVRAGYTLAALATFALTWSLWVPLAGEDHERHDLARLAKILQGRKALIDGAHIYRYYLGDDYALKPISVSADNRNLLIRDQGSYRQLTRDDVKGSLVLIQKRRRFEPEYRNDLGLTTVKETGLHRLLVFETTAKAP